jgi:hypothetical protein
MEGFRVVIAHCLVFGSPMAMETFIRLRHLSCQTILERP